MLIIKGNIDIDIDIVMKLIKNKKWEINIEQY